MQLELDGQNAESSLQFALLFEPLKPFSATAELIVLRAAQYGGGRWRYGITLTATEPGTCTCLHILTL